MNLNKRKNLPVILICQAVKAIKLRAYDYITRDFDYDTILNLSGRALEKQYDKKNYSTMTRK
ncbi:MAG: hypothetical protein ACMUJM_18850 [bacterium]